MSGVIGNTPIKYRANIRFYLCSCVINYTRDAGSDRGGILIKYRAIVVTMRFEESNRTRCQQNSSEKTAFVKVTPINRKGNAAAAATTSLFVRSIGESILPNKGISTLMRTERNYISRYDDKVLNIIK